MEKNKENSFLLGLSITLGTIVIGLSSFLLYTNEVSNKPLRCEYNGWAYADSEIYDSTDGCNVCFCNNGKTVCTEKECGKKVCTYEGNTYREGEKIKSDDKCNICECIDGEITCTSIDCE